MTIRDISEEKIIFCPNCSFLISIRKILKENKLLLEYIFCPECGIKIEFGNYITKNEDVFNLSEKFYDKNELNKALEMIFDENRISSTFKKQLSFLISRMTYIEFKNLEEEIGTSISQIILTNQMIQMIEDKISLTSDQFALLNILKCMNEIYDKDLLSDLRTFQKRVNKKKKSRKALSNYVRWMIVIVKKILNNIEDTKGLLNYEKTIPNDLFNFFQLNSKCDYIHLINEKYKNTDEYLTKSFIMELLEEEALIQKN